MLTRRLFLEGLECQCRIGAYDHERLGPQRVIIDIVLELSADTEPGRDHLEDTLNYDLVRQAVLDIAGARHFDLQETLAREMFDALQAARALLTAEAERAAYDALDLSSRAGGDC